ncbi:DNA-binding transcription factor yap1 [Rhizoclosmatium sp. JEL0117]|nr:DNA-binding transcription factor yap1 [Rhizoclosmatium sp. JEL0117]
MASFCPLSTLAALSASAFTMIESNADADTNTGPTESRSPSAGPSESLQSDAARCSAACPRDDGDCGGAAEKKPRAKAGRKLTTTEPENKRIAQTRAAQRAFRERKKLAFEQKEQRVNELELLLSVSQQESEGLRIQLERLAQENARLRSQLTHCSCPSTSSATIPSTVIQVKSEPDRIKEDGFTRNGDSHQSMDIERTEHYLERDGNKSSECKAYWNTCL